jgi:glycosyltransferase involved in cell wall biosynthesis
VPKVTVLMPVYNGENYLREAMDSILNQNFTDFEFLIIDDGSTDGSVGVISSYMDPRIRLEQNGVNQGLIFTLNKGIDLAQGEYIARMDCDDISVPHRLSSQVALLDQNPDIGLCGTSMKFMNMDVWVRHPEPHDEIKCRLLFQCTLNHPTVMMRKSVLTGYGLYYDWNALHAEDYELWVRMSNLTRMMNIQDDMLWYRIHPEQIGAKHNVQQQITGRQIVLQQLRNIGLEPTPEELELHWSLWTHNLQPALAFVESVGTWFNRIREFNGMSLYFEPETLNRVLDEYYNEALNYYMASRVDAQPAVPLRKKAVRKSVTPKKKIKSSPAKVRKLNKKRKSSGGSGKTRKKPALRKIRHQTVRKRKGKQRRAA